MSGLHKSPGEFLSDICDGEIMEEKAISQSSVPVLQIIAYFDEMTLTNPLMSRAKKYKIGVILLHEV